MQLVDLTWSCYRVPFRDAFVTAHGTLSHRSGALVTARADNGYTGYGEIAPLPEQSGQSLDTSLNALSRLAPTLRGRKLLDILRFLEIQSADGQLPAPLICGLETALLDAIGQASGLRVADLLARDYSSRSEQLTPPVPRNSIAVNMVLSGATIDAAVANAQRAIAAGFTCLKLKLTNASSATIERVAAVRTAIGPAPRLRLDANASWNSAQAHTLLTQCAPYDIEYIEQPLPAHDLAGMAALRRVSPIPLAVDEAVTSLESARNVLRASAADVLILKPQLAGGLLSCRKIIQEASTQGIDCVITSTLETGIGVTAALHLAAASPTITRPCGLTTLNLLTSDLLQTDLPIYQGTLKLPDGPGLGVHLDQDALHSFMDEKTQ